MTSPSQPARCGKTAPRKSMLALWTAEERQRERLSLCVELPKIAERLRRCGLHATATRMESALQAIGWEVAEDLPGLAKYERARNKSRSKS